MIALQVPLQFTTPPSFNVSLDGSSYTLTVFYSYFGQRLYFKITDTTGNVIVIKPLISSAGTLNNLFGYFKITAMYYSQKDQLITVV